MKTLKIILRSFIIPLIMCAVVVTSALANSNTWNFAMSYLESEVRATNRSMTSGRLIATGSVKVTKNMWGNDPRKKPALLYIIIKQDIPFWPDPEICSTTLQLDSKVGSSKSISLSCPSIKSGNYYFFIARSFGDGFSIQGDGTIKTTP